MNNINQSCFSFNQKIRMKPHKHNKLEITTGTIHKRK